MPYESLIPIRETREFAGLYPIQLDIPEGSTLTPDEIGLIGSLASWKTDPNNRADGYEGSRAVLVRRDHPLSRGGIELGALQVSGIGSFRVSAEEDSLRKQLFVHMSEGFRPPSADNFMDVFPQDSTTMGTQYARGSTIVDDRPTYRPYGTYNGPELSRAVLNTHNVSLLSFSRLVTPIVEAYGRYLSLHDDDGPFGFVVLPIPSADAQRAGDECTSLFTDIARGNAYHDFINLYRKSFSIRFPLVSTIAQEQVLAFYCLATTFACPLVASLRELHDQRYGHMQAHMSNYYLVEGQSYLMDWVTMVQMGTDPEENLRIRALDMMKPAEDYIRLLSNCLEAPQEVLSLTKGIIESLVMDVYDGSGTETNLLALMERTVRVRGPEATNLDAFVQWLKEHGFEGFASPLQSSTSIHYSTSRPPRYEMQYDVRPSSPSRASKRDHGQKIGRNDPCSCGSGIKFKKCCGGH